MFLTTKISMGVSYQPNSYIQWAHRFHIGASSLNNNFSWVKHECFNFVVIPALVPIIIHSWLSRSMWCIETLISFLFLFPLRSQTCWFFFTKPCELIWYIACPFPFLSYSTKLSHVFSVELLFADIYSFCCLYRFHPDGSYMSIHWRGPNQTLAQTKPWPAAHEGGEVETYAVHKLPSLP